MTYRCYPCVAIVLFLALFPGGVQHLAFTFDSPTQNLLNRTDLLKGLSETFTYDGLDRLVQSQVAGQAAVTLSYASNGNITHKSDAGAYAYDAQKIHALSAITNPQTAIPSATQTVSYTSRQDPLSISEDGLQLDFLYGDAGARKQVTLSQGGTPLRTRYYLGAYERNDATGAPTQHIHYISGGDGLCTIAVRENGTDSYYYVYKDYLGSILSLTDASGSLVAEQSFDAWGRVRNPADWTYSSPSPVPNWLYRGYTGHEQLPGFSLIHMNGRLYDPVLGRMLSPDNYVHDWLGSQGYNRYAYVGNNPLKFTDPSGEIVVAPILVGVLSGALIGAASSGLMYSAMAGNQWTWRGFGTSLAFGAISGAVSGGIGGAAKGSALAQNLAFGVLRQSAGNLSANLLMGNDLSLGMVVGSVVSGVINGAIPGFTGVEGGALANVTAELMHNAGRGMLSGGMGGMVGAALDGSNMGDGLANGMLAGMFTATVNTALTISFLGAAYVPPREYGDKSSWGNYSPVYRRGTFITRALFRGGGIAIGRNLVTYELSPRHGSNFGINDRDFNHSLRAHETKHYLQQLNLGWANYYSRSIGEYADFGFQNSYTTLGSLEHQANMYSLSILGYWYDTFGVRHLRP